MLCCISDLLIYLIIKGLTTLKIKSIHPFDFQVAAEKPGSLKKFMILGRTNYLFSGRNHGKTDLDPVGQ